MELPKDLKDEIWEYCRLNDITDLNAFIIRMLRQGYSTEKYGPTPFKVGGNSEKETIVEKIVEVPVEVIKEVEKIVEVPIEVVREIVKEIPVEIIKEVIKEVPVDKIIEKEVYITNDQQVTELMKRIQELESTPPKVIEIEKEIIVEKEVPFEVIKEVVIERIIEINDPEKVRKLEQEIENLKIELELEQNRRLEKKKIEQPKEGNGQKNILSNVINWVSKSEREKKDLYDE